MDESPVIWGSSGNGKYPLALLSRVLWTRVSMMLNGRCILLGWEGMSTAVGHCAASQPFPSKKTSAGVLSLANRLKKGQSKTFSVNLGLDRRGKLKMIRKTQGAQTFPAGDRIRSETRCRPCPGAAALPTALQCENEWWATSL